MTNAMIFLYGICIAWILLCGRVWWSMGPKHRFQRRLVALGAGLGAAMFYYAGARIVTAYERYQTQQEAAPVEQEVSVSLKRKVE